MLHKRKIKIDAESAFCGGGVWGRKRNRSEKKREVTCVYAGEDERKGRKGSLGERNGDMEGKFRFL